MDRNKLISIRDIKKSPNMYDLLKYEVYHLSEIPSGCKEVASCLTIDQLLERISKNSPEDLKERYKVYLKQDIDGNDFYYVVEEKSNITILFNTLRRISFLYFKIISSLYFKIISLTIIALAVVFLTLSQFSYRKSETIKPRDITSPIASVGSYDLYLLSPENRNKAISIYDFYGFLVDDSIRMLKSKRVGQYPVYLTFSDTEACYVFTGTVFDPLEAVNVNGEQGENVFFVIVRRVE